MHLWFLRNDFSGIITMMRVTIILHWQCMNIV